MRIRARLCSAVVRLVLFAATAGCASVPPHFSLPPLSLGEPSFFPTLEAYSVAPIVGGNSVEFLLNGEQIFPSMVEAINAGQRTITYAQYYYEDGPVARDVAEALAERCRNGVGVNVLLDSFGALGMPAEYTELMKRSARQTTAITAGSWWWTVASGSRAAPV
jgi:cardiolipin synthase